MTPATTEDDASRSPFAPAYRGATTGMVTLISLAAFESLAVTTAMPVVVRDLGGLGLYAAAFAGPLASSVVGMVLAGGWSDRRGPTRPMVVGVLLFCLGLLVAGAAGAMPVVVAGRVVQGLGSGMFTVALYVVVARVYPEHLRARVFAAFAAAWVVPAVVGPALAGLVSEHLGWRWVFLSVPLLAVPALALLRPTLRRLPATTTGTPWPRRRLLLALGAATALLVLHGAGQSDGPVAVALLASGSLALVLTVPGLVPAGTHRAARGLPTVVLLRGLLAAGFFSAEVYLPLLLTQERGLRPGQAGLALTAAAVTWSLGSSARGRRERAWADHRVLVAGAAAAFGGVVVVASVLHPQVPVWVALAGWAVGGFGMGLAYPTTSLLTLRLSAPEEQGSSTSALQVNEAVSVALVLAVSGPLFAALANHRPTSAYLAVLGVSAGLAVLAALLAPRVRVRPVPDAATGPSAGTVEAGGALSPAGPARGGAGGPTPGAGRTGSIG